MFSQGGSITVISGCMYSGKTDEMLRLVRRAEIAGRRVIVFDHAVNDRVGGNQIRSRSNATANATAVASSAEIPAIAAKGRAQVIAIEEAQFFDEGLVNVVARLANEGRQVIVSGLDTDFAARPFGPMPELLAIADEVRKLTAICHICGSEQATRTQRLLDGVPVTDPDAPLVVIGGMDADGAEHVEAYEARCRRCYVHRGE
jgi:thymidine kinase